MIHPPIEFTRMPGQAAKSQMGEKKAQPVQATSTIVVAAVPLGFGAVLSKDNTVEMPWSGPPIRAAFTTKEELLKEGRRVVLTPPGAKRTHLSAQSDRLGRTCIALLAAGGRKTCGDHSGGRRARGCRLRAAG